MPNALAAPAVSGDFTLGQLKDIEKFRAELDEDEGKLKEKFGKDWKLVIDWPSFAKYSKEHGERHRIGEMAISYMVSVFIRKDIEKADADVVEALNEKVGGTKVVRFVLGPNTAKYNFNRINVEADTKGITITIKQEYLQTEYEENYLTKWALKNC